MTTKEERFLIQDIGKGPADRKIGFKLLFIHEQ